MGKKSTPAPPDYTAAAKATAEGNQQNLAAQTLANRANQFTPWGSLVWDRQVTKNPLTGEDEVTWTSYEDVAPELQQALQNEFGISNARTAIAGGLLGRIADSYGQGLDLSGLPEMQSIDPSKFDDWSRLTADPGFGAVQEVQDAMMSRMAPDLQQARDREVQRLKAQGITEGSMAFDRAMERLDRAETDARQQALLGAAQEYGNIFNRSAQATNMANALRQAQMAEAANLMGASGSERTRAIQEMSFLRNLPLNELNALLGGGQVQNPQFENYNLAGYMPGPDLMGAAKADYQARLDAANAANAGKSNLTKGLFGLAGSAIGGPIGGVLGGQLGSMFG
jgi:hypothetical protein